MEHSLTLSQIDQLFAFTKEHFVEYYDVQVELVDHLANAIEYQWKENPHIMFEEALQAEFKKFGVFGFTDLVEQKQAKLHSYYYKMIWKELVKFISIPKVLLTVGLYFSLFFLIKSFQPISGMVLAIFILTSFFYYVSDGFRFNYMIRKKQKNKNQSWLIQSVASQVYMFPIIVSSGSWYMLFNSFFSHQKFLSNIALHAMTIFGLFHFTIIFIMIFIIKPKLKNEIVKTEQRFQFV